MQLVVVSAVTAAETIAAKNFSTSSSTRLFILVQKLIALFTIYYSLG